MPGDGVTSIPGVGAVVSLFKGYDAGYKGLIPPYIVLTEPQGRFSEAGFPGTSTSRSPPAATRRRPLRGRGRGRPGHHRPAAAATAANCSTSSTRWARHARHPSSPPSTKSEKQAYDLILGDGGKVFDLSQEKDDLRDRYGRNTFGQSCLMARRLVERGVPYVTINYKRLGHAQAAFPDHAPQAAGNGQGHGDAAAGPGRPRAAGQHGHLVLRRVRPHAQGDVGSSPGTAGAGTGAGVLGAGRRRRVQGRASRRRLGRQGRRAVKDRPVYPCDLLAACTRCWESTRGPGCRTRRGWTSTSARARRRRPNRAESSRRSCRCA